MKKYFYLEIILTIGSRIGLSIYFLPKYFKKYGFSFRKIFLLLLCLKLLLIDPFSQIPAKAQTIDNNFELVKLQSPPVSFDTSLLPAAVKLSSLPISLSTTNFPSVIKLSSDPVSFSTSNLASSIKLSSNPVSYLISQTASLIKSASLPVSYSLTSFTGEAIKLLSDNVAYKVYNSVPLLELVSPNLLPISRDGKSIDISLQGDNFVKNTIASIGILKIQTKYISQKELIATIPANFLNKENNFEIFVANPPPEGGISKGFNIMVVNPVPIAKINASPSIGVAPQIIIFDGRDTEDLLAKYFGQALTYSWNFGESTDSTENPNTSNDPVVSHTYKTPGKYTAALNVVNAYGKVSTVTKQIEIREKNFAPEGIYTADKTNSDVPCQVLFTSNVTDTENDDILYFWEFGDGETSIEKNPAHTYTIAGKYLPKLTVSDSLGAKTAITSSKLTLLSPNNLPVVEIAAIPKESILKLTNEGFFTGAAQFISNGTYDPDGEELTYLWDFGDGEISNEINPKHEYRNAGNYNIKLTVTDSRNGQNIKTVSTLISKPQPQAIAKLDQTTGNSPFDVTFDGRNSQDYDSSPVTLRWDFGDGTVKESGSGGETGIVRHTYQDPGVYLVSLTASTADNRSVKINPGNIIVGPNNGPVGQIIKLEGDKSGILGKGKVTLSAAGSYDPNLGDTINRASTSLKYKWSWSARTWDANGNLIDISKDINNELTSNELQTTSNVFEYTFTRTGQFTPVLEIEKADGTKAKFFGETFTITPDQAPVAVAKILSDKTAGAPGLEISFDGSESYDPKTNGGLKILTWDFGDGEKSTEVSPKHVYNKEGTFTPTLVAVDNANNIGFAQAASIKITNQINDTNGNTLARINLFQTTEGNTEPTQEEIQPAIDAMIKEAANAFISNDNKKPEIGPITIEPKTVSPGGVIKLSCFVKDNIGLSNFGYTLIDSNEKIISRKIIDLLNKNDDKIIRDEFFIDENIQIPEYLLPGNYKIKLAATDTTGNQIAKSTSSASTNEEIVVDFEVLNQNTQTAASVNTIILPSDTEKVSAYRDTGALKRKYTKISAHENEQDKPDLTGFFVRGRNIKPALQTSHSLARINDTGIEKHNKYLVDNFQVTNATYIVNPWISISPSSTKTLDIDTLSERDGYIEIGTKGSLAGTYFSKWYTTNIYVDYKKVGNIPWYFGAGISYTSDVANPVKTVEFRPADSAGNELSSVTWVKKSFIFTKIIQPQLTSVFPAEGTAGRGAFDLRINGNNFTTTSKVYFDGYLLTPYAVSSTVLYVRIPAYLVSYLGFKAVSVLNLDGSQSGTQYYTAKANQNNPCNINKTLPQAYWGADAQTILDGNNTFLSSQSAVIEGNGTVTIPFCLDTNYDVGISLNLQHYKNLSGGTNYIYFWLDGNYLRSTFAGTSQSLSFNNIVTRNLSGGLHELKINFNGGSNDQLYINDVTFSNGGIILNSIDPTSVTLEGTGRVLNLYGSNFDQSLNVLADGQLLTKLSVTGNKIVASLPDKFSSIGPKAVQLVGNGKQSSTLQLSVKNSVELINSSFKVTPVQPFPGNSFDIELRVKDNQAGTYTATIAIYDPDGKLLTIPNISNYYSTVLLTGVKDLNSDILFKGSIPFLLQTKAGNYTAIAFVKRISGSDEDYSNLYTAQYIYARGLGLSYLDSQIPASHKLTFTPKPAVLTVFGVEENSFDNAGFIQAGNKVIQDSQSVKYKVQISSGQENASKLRYNFISGDGKESGQTSSDNFTFTYQNPDTSSATPKTANPKLEIFWVEDGIQTKIGTYNGPTVFIYPNYSPIAKAKVSGDIFATTPPLFTTFLDLDSYDPNQRFSSAIDFVDSTNSKWDFYQLKFNQDAQLISLPIDAKISSDRKTFDSGKIYTPGSYFAKLTVRDKTNLTDTASTESVTLTWPSQMVIVFATTDPSDKKVFDPTQVETSLIPGVPVQFKSEVTVLGGRPALAYRWDFADGACIGDDVSKLPEDCTSPNPKHFYYDEKKSFMGQPFIDRRSITPKLTVSANFPGGKTETWEASAGTITFHADPHFILLNIIPDSVNGIVPFTVNLMIDSTTAKAVNTTIAKYELDWNDGSSVIASEAKQSQAEITLQDILSQTFTHTYTKPGTYTPRLTVFVKETTRTFVFNVPAVTVAGTGVSGVYLLDDLSRFSFTNQPIVTFMVLASFANPLDPNNSLRIKVKDEDENETVTELDPDNSNQTISLSEGKNTYYFEASDSSKEVIMSETREIVLDTETPVLDIISPNEDDLISDKLVISGTLEDKLFDSVSYKINSKDKAVTIPADDLEDLGEDKKAFNIILEPGILDTQISQITVTVKDKAGNITSDEINIGSDKTAKFLSKEVINGAVIVKNDGSSHQIKQGKPFQLSTTANICDDTQKKGSDYQSKLIISSNSYTINGTENKTTYQNVPGGITSIIPGATGLLNGCATQDNVFYSGVFNLDDTVNELFLPASPLGNPTLHWPIGKYNIEQTLTAAPQSLSTYGTTFENSSLTTMATFLVEVTRNINAEITALTPQNILWNKQNNITFNLTLSDSTPISDKDHLPIIGQGFIQTPSGIMDNVSISCVPKTIISYPVMKITESCSFSYTPKELTNSSAGYTLTIPVSFAPDSGNLSDARPLFSAEYSGIRSNFEIAAVITKPDEYTVIQSSKALISSILDKIKLPAELQPVSLNKIKNLARYGIKFGFDNKIRIITSGNNYDSIVKGVSASSLDQNTILFDYNLNFNLSTENDFKDAFENLSAIGPIYLYNEISSLSPTSASFSYTEPQELILLDKPNTKGILKTNLKTNTKSLNLTIKNNIPGYGPNGQKFPLELIIEPKDASGMILGTAGEFNTSVLIPRNTRSVTKKINNLPLETTEVLVTLRRSDNFLNFVQDKLNKENFNFNIVTDEYKTVSSSLIKSGATQVTSCSLNPDTANTDQGVDFNYTLKSTKSVNIFANGKRPDGTVDRSILLPSQFRDKIDWAQSGIISFTVPEEWNIYSEITFNLVSGDESAEGRLRVGGNVSFKIGDLESKTVTYNEKTVSVTQLKDLLVTLGYLSQTDALVTGYTDPVNQAYWKFACAVDKTKALTLDPNLRLQTTSDPLKCTVTYTETPDIKYTEDVSIWIEVINGLRTKVGQDISAFINPMTIGTLAAIVAWNTILPINSWLLLVTGIISAEADITTRSNEVKDLWNNPSNRNANQTKGWKTGYTIGTLLTAIPGILPANLANEVKVAEEAAKLDSFSNIQDLILSEQRTINSLSGLEPVAARQNKLNNFVTIVEKVNQSGKKVFNDVIQRLKDRNYDKFLPVNKFGLAAEDNIGLLTRVINRDELAISLTDQELNDLLFTIARNVKEERLNELVYTVTNNLIKGSLTKSMNVGKRILRESAAQQVLSGERGLANPSGETFCVDSNEILNLSTIEILSKLGLDTIEEIKRFIGQKIYIFEIPVNNLELGLPTVGNESLVTGGITSGGELEFVIKGGWPSTKLNQSELESLGAKIYEKDKLSLTENDIRNLLNNSLNPPLPQEINTLIDTLKGDGSI